MTQETLKRILSIRGETASILDDVISMTNTQLAIRDMENNLLFGAVDADSDEIQDIYTIRHDGEAVGSVSGGAQGRYVAALLTYLIAREIEKEELLEEILDLYRQVNLLFSLSEKLAAPLELDTVAQTTLEEASRLIKATGGAVVLFNEEGAPLLVANIGHGIPAELNPGPEGGILGAVMADGRAEIINDVNLDPRYAEEIDLIRSLLCAPLTAKDKTMGAIIIANEVPVTYTAADLNLLNTLASQAAPAIENALFYERALREAQEREELLQRQVLELRIELDEARQEERVAEITGSEYYQRLRDRADMLRSIMGTSSTR